MPFTLVGVSTSLTGPPAVAGVAVSTFETDRPFVKEAEFPAATAALRGRSPGRGCCRDRG
jgi:hypothetical protein